MTDSEREWADMKRRIYESLTLSEKVRARAAARDQVARLTAPAVDVSPREQPRDRAVVELPAPAVASDAERAAPNEKRRTQGANPRALGTNPRALGTNPRDAAS